MKPLSVNLKQLALVTSLGAVVLAAAPQILPAHAAPLAPQPLVLTARFVPTKTLAAVPSTGTPSNITYTFTSTGPFCIDGLRMDPHTAGPVGPGSVGDVYAYLDYIDGFGVSHGTHTLVEGASGGFRPQDLVISHGAALCANRSIQLAITAYQPAAGPGVAIGVSGQAIILAAYGVTVTVT